METYKRRLKRQNMALWCGIVLLAALDVVLGIFWDDLGLDVFQMTQQARTMQSMLLFGFLIYFIVRLVKNKRRLKDPWAYEEEARRQGDERRILVGEKAAKLSADLALAGLTVAVFFTSLCTTWTCSRRCTMPCWPLWPCAWPPGSITAGNIDLRPGFVYD